MSHEIDQLLKMQEEQPVARVFFDKLIREYHERQAVTPEVLKDYLELATLKVDNGASKPKETVKK